MRTYINLLCLPTLFKSLFFTFLCSEDFLYSVLNLVTATWNTTWKETATWNLGFLGSVTLYVYDEIYHWMRSLYLKASN